MNSRLKLDADKIIDVSGGYVDGDTYKNILEKDISFSRMFENNDYYHILEQCEELIKTGSTGTNVNDFSVVLIDEKSYL